MALSNTNRGTGNHNSSSTSVSASPTSDFDLNSYAILSIAYDNAGTNGADPYSSISDSVGNTWTSLRNQNRDPGAANEGVSLRVFGAKVLTAITTSDTVTVDFGAFSVVAKAWTFHQISASANNTPIYSSLGSTSGAATSFTTTSVAVASGDLVLGVTGYEYGQTITADSDTTNGNWSTQQNTNIGSTTSGIGIGSQVKVTTGAATQTYNTSVVTSCDYAIIHITFIEVPDESVVIRNFAANGDSGLTSVITLNAPTYIRTGCRVILSAAYEPILSPGTLQVADGAVWDGKGNTWSQPGFNTYTSLITAAVANGADLLGLYTSPDTDDEAPSAAISIVYYGRLIDVTTYNSLSTNSGTSTTASLTVTSVPFEGFCVVHVFGLTNGTLNTAADSDTTNGSWSAVSSLSGNVFVKVQSKVVTASGNQSYSATLSSSSTDWEVVGAKYSFTILVEETSILDPFGTFGIFGI